MAALLFVALSSLLLVFLPCHTASKCKDFKELVDKDAIKDSGVWFYYDACSRDTNCSVCSNTDGSQVIQEAYICEEEGNVECKKIPLPHTSHHFIVHIPGEHFEQSHAGEHDYLLEYEYSCENEEQNATSLCLQQFHLNLRVADFNLQLESSEVVVEGIGEDSPIVELSEGSSATLKCSSGLQRERDIPVQFIFTPQSNPNEETSMICESFNKKPIPYGDGWIVERQQKTQEPYICLLHLTSISQNESGTYCCVGILPHGLGHHSDRSISIILASELTNPRSRPFNSQPAFSTIMQGAVGFVISLIVITVVGICSVSIGYSVYKRHRNPEDQQHPHRDERRGMRNGYGSGGQTASLVKPKDDAGSEPEGSDIEVEKEEEDTMVPNVIEVPVEVEPASLGGVSQQPTPVPDSEHRLETHIPLDRGDPPQPPPVLHEDDPPPASLDGHPPQSTLRPVSPTAVLPRPMVAISPPNVSVLVSTEKLEDPESTGPHTQGESDGHSSGAESPQFPLSMSGGSSSTGGGSGPPSHGSTASTDTQKAVDLYHLQTGLPPAEGKTPESRLPPDPNYTCPVCRKQYPGDQRQFFIRHMEECKKKVTKQNAKD